jgi:hypothetical protein
MGHSRKSSTPINIPKILFPPTTNYIASIPKFLFYFVIKFLGYLKKVQRRTPESYKMQFQMECILFVANSMRLKPNKKKKRQTSRQTEIRENERRKPK